MPKVEPQVGVQYFGFADLHEWADIQQRTRHLLARSLNTGRVVAVVGSGVSVNYGYPSWKEFTEDVVEEVADALKKDRRTDLARSLTRALRTAFAESAQPTRPRPPLADRLTCLLDMCQDYYSRTNKGLADEHVLREFVQRSFNREPTTADATSPDPLRLLIANLGIQRFLTSNYDTAIEDRLKEHLETGHHDPTSDERSALEQPLSVSLETSSIDALVAFTIGAGPYRHSVFHAHGRADSGPLVVTESDYRRLYARGGERYRTQREALALTFFANPILFVGSGMGEPDLLRPLRELAAEQRDVRERPLFALLEEPSSKDERKEMWHFLYARYGVKTIFYAVPNGATSRERGRELCAAIESIGKDWHTWWDRWQAKPYVRKPKFGIVEGADTKAMVRYNTTEPDGFFVGEWHKTSVTRALPVRPPGGTSQGDTASGTVVLALGRAGMGKGGLANDIVLDSSVAVGPGGRRFCATLHFSNDFLSVIDAAADHLLGEDEDRSLAAREERDPIERLRDALAARQHLVVIGGIERALSPLSPRDGPATWAADGDRATGATWFPIGAPVNLEVRRFFAALGELVTNGQLRSSVVLTSAVVPQQFIPLLPEQVVPVELTGADKNALHDRLTLLADEDVVNGIYEALRGHAYLLWIVAEAVRGDDPENAARWLGQLRSRLTAVDYMRRGSDTVQAVVDRFVERFVEPDGPYAKALHVLERLSLLSMPVRKEDLEAVLGDGLGAVLEELSDRYLVLVGTSDDEHDRADRYTTHTVVRSHFLEQLGNSVDPVAEVHRFDLTGYSTDVPDTQSFSKHGHQRATETVDALLDAAEAILPKLGNTTLRGGYRTDAGRLAIATFAAIRGRWTATGIGRFLDPADIDGASDQPSHHEAYIKRLVRLLNVIRTLSFASASGEPGGWTSRTLTREQIERALHESGVLYVDELAWLYNEVALASFCRGSMHDAFALYRMGEDVNRVAERGSPGQRYCESEIGLGIVATEMAQLGRAHDHLENALDVAKRRGEQELAARARGHLGLVHHLTGKYRAAEEDYEAAIKDLEPLGNRRALSMFSRHRGDLYRLLEKLDDARTDIGMSIAEAESGRHYDLLHHARIAEANLDLAVARAGHLTQASQLPPLRKLRAVVRYARASGLPKLEQDASQILANIALDRGDTELASRLAQRSIGLCSLYGMRLRLTGSLVLMGRVTMERGEPDSARLLLEHAAQMAERQRYQVQMEYAQRLLMKLHQAKV